MISPIRFRVAFTEILIGSVLGVTASFITTCHLICWCLNGPKAGATFRRLIKVEIP